MAHRICVFAFLAAAACLPARAQTPQPSADDTIRALDRLMRDADAFQPVRPAPAINLQGEWDVDQGTRRLPMRVRLTVSGGMLSATDISPTSPNRGRVIFSGMHGGEPSFLVTILPLSNPPRTFSMAIKDPDTLTSPSFIFRRISPPPLDDFPCDAANSFHVQRAGIWARANAAADAHDDSKAYCWISVAAAAGDIEAEYYKALYLAQGIGTEKNTHAAFLWLSRSAGEDFLDAEKELATFYERGIGTRASPEDAKFWHDIWQRQLTEKQQEQAERLRQGVDSVQGALDGIFGTRVGGACGMSPEEVREWEKYHPDSLTGPSCFGRRPK